MLTTLLTLDLYNDTQAENLYVADNTDTSFYPAATLETTGLATQRLYYAGVDTGRVNKSTVAGYPNDTHSNPNDFIQKLNGNGHKVGTNMVLKVMPARP